MRAENFPPLRFIKAKNGIYTRSGASFFNPRGTGRCVGGARRRSDYRLPDANPRHWPLDGGTEIEEVAEKTPELIHKIIIDPIQGLTDADADALATKIGVPQASLPAARQILH